MGLRTRLLLLVLLCTVPALLLALFNNLQQRRLGALRVQKDAMRVAQLAAATQNGLIQATRQHLSGLSHFPQTRGNDLVAFDTFFGGMLKVYTDYVDFGLIETNGKLVSCSFGRNGPTNLRDHAELQLVLKTHDLAVGEYQEGDSVRKSNLPFGYPVLDETGQVVRVLYTSLDLTAMNAALAKVRPPEEGVIEVFDSHGHLLARNLEPSKWVGKSLPDLSAFTKTSTANESTEEMRGLDGVPRLNAFSIIRNSKEPSLFVSVGIPTSLAYAESNDILIRDLSILGAVSALALIAAWSYANRHILRPVRALSDTTRRLAAGDLSVQAEIHQASGELKQLARSFNEMAASLQQQRFQTEQSQQALRESERRFRQLADAMPQIVWTALPDGRLDYYNARWYEFTGLPRNGTGGTTSWKQVLHPDDAEAYFRQWAEAVRSGAAYQGEYRLKDRRIDSYRWHLGRAVPVRDDHGQIVHWFGTFTDIDDQKLSEEQVRRLNTTLETRVADRTAELESLNKELEAFSYSVSHDLRAPLRHIGAYVTILQEESQDNLSEQGNQFLKIVSDSARQMSALIDGLLAFSRMSRKEVCRKRIHTGELINEILREMKQDIERRNIRWHIEPLPTVFADRTMLKQVWANLLSNAVKYTRNCQTAEIRVGSRDKPREIEFYVSDNGAGFDMRHAGKLFGVFERLHPTAQFEGTGIGLANVHRIVTRHGGRVWAEAKVDKGATFYFTMPKSPDGMSDESSQTNPAEERQPERC
jgi:PAS domain S-box-containing protein